jgi:hypothetical protein
VEMPLFFLQEEVVLIVITDDLVFLFLPLYKNNVVPLKPGYEEKKSPFGQSGQSAVSSLGRSSCSVDIF